MNQFILKSRILLLQNKFYYLLFVLATMFALLSTNLVEYNSKYNNNDINFNLKIISYKIDGNKLALELKAKEKLIGIYYFETEKEKNTFANIYSIGDIIRVEGELIKPNKNTIPNTFNYKNYLRNKKIYYTINIEEFSLTHKNRNIFYKVKDYVYKRVSRINNNEYIYALVLGESLYIDSESFRINGVSHLFALSGLHVSIMSMMILKIIKIIKKIFSKIKNKVIEEKIHPYIFIFLFLLLFSFITGFKPSFIRAILFFILLGMNKVYYFNVLGENVLIIVYFIMVLINPFYIYDISFQLSWIITFFLLFTSNMIKENNYIIKLLWTSLISMLATLPILINNFYMVNLLSVLNNLIFVPFVSFVIYPLSLLTFIFPFLNKILSFLTNILEIISKFLENIKIFTINFPKISIYIIIIYYILFLLIIKSKNKIKFIIMIFLLLVYGYYKNNFDRSIHIYFIDVGQGDSCLIVTPNKKTILIDTGGVMKYEKEEWMIKNKNFNLMNSSIIPFFKSIGIKKIDYLFLSHADEDHSGYAKTLSNNFLVDNIIINNGEVLEIEKELNYQIAKRYYEIDNIKIHSLNNKIYNNENDNSLILLIEINNERLLFMGDASIKQEKEILKEYNLKNIFILKVGHHGSKTSTSNSLINTITPKYSIISVGKNNRFGHPNETVIDLLDKNNSTIYRTDISGSIEFIIEKNNYKIKTYYP